MKVAFILFALVLIALGVTQGFLHDSPKEQEPIPLPSQPEVEEVPEETPYAPIAAEITQLFKSSKFEEALRKARSVLEARSQEEEFVPWIERQMPQILIGLGWQRVHEENCSEAISNFEEALRYENLPLAYKGLGICYFLSKQHWLASNYLRRFLDETFDFDSTMVLLESLESLGQLEDAWLKLEELGTQEGLTQEQKEMVERRSSTMKEKLKESDHQTSLDGRYVTLHYRAIDHEDLGLWAIDVLDQAVEDLIQVTDLPYPQGAIEVFLYPIDGFQKIHHGPSWAQGLYDGRIRIPIPKLLNDGNRRLLKRTLRHEISHALLTESVNQSILPTWFQEGLAQYVECSPYCNQFTFPSSRGSFLSKKVFESSFVSLNHQEARLAYSQSLFLVQNLIRISGPQILGTIIKNQQQRKRITSTSLLDPASISFGKLYQIASKNWEVGKKF